MHLPIPQLAIITPDQTDYNLFSSKSQRELRSLIWSTYIHWLCDYILTRCESKTIHYTIYPQIDNFKLYCPSQWSSNDRKLHNLHCYKP